MKTKTDRTKERLLGLLLVLTMAWAAAPCARAEDEPDTTVLDQAAAADETKVNDQLGERFSSLAGSAENVRSLVKGLRHGSDVTLKTTGADGTETVNTFSPKTGKMGYGNVYISLALAQESLKQSGITSPTSAELQAVLNGGTVTAGDGRSVTFAGVLAQRSAGQGWGQIAKSQGVNLGGVIGDLRRADRTADKPDKPIKPERPGKPDRPEKPGRPERPERPEKGGRP